MATVQKSRPKSRSSRSPSDDSYFEASIRQFSDGQESVDGVIVNDGFGDGVNQHSRRQKFVPLPVAERFVIHNVMWHAYTPHASGAPIGSEESKAEYLRYLAACEKLAPPAHLLDIPIAHGNWSDGAECDDDILRTREGAFAHAAKQNQDVTEQDWHTVWELGKPIPAHVSLRTGGARGSYTRTMEYPIRLVVPNAAEIEQFATVAAE